MERVLGSNWLKNAVISAAILWVGTTGVAFGGGVSDGGGGTTNPYPASPAWIAEAAGRNSGQILLLWLNEQEKAFNERSTEEQDKSPFFKLFRSSRSVFDVVRKASIELRISEPCYDKNGAPWDGSIYATKPGAICISPFSMAPKLNDVNFEAETVALIMHELSHLLGTTEDEARAIQRIAVYDFSRMDFINTVVKLEILSDRSGAGRIRMIEAEIEMLDRPSVKPHRSDVSHVISQITSLRDDLELQFLRAKAVRESTIKEFNPQHVRELVIQQSICASDAIENSGVRKNCVNWIATAFAGGPVATAKDILVRTNPEFSNLGPEFDAVTIRNPVTVSDLRTELRNLQGFLQKVLGELVSTASLQLNVYRKE